MKYLITGISGFVGYYVIKYLQENVNESTISGIDRNCLDTEHFSNLDTSIIDFSCSTLTDTDYLIRRIEKIKPDYIIHLASQSSVAYSWQNPIDTFVNNTKIFLHLLEAVRKSGVSPTILSVGSSEEYGIVSEHDIPLFEDMYVKPSNPYAISRVAQENLSRLYVDAYNLKIMCTRSFNHVGPFQRETFVISSFVKQAVEIKKGFRDIFLCGDLQIIRDFIDVRDVVKAYMDILMKGKMGEIYNVCSGNGVMLSEIVDKIKTLLDIDFPVKLHDELIRPIDNPVIIGSNKKLIQEIGFTPGYTLEQSLKDMISFWDNRIN